MAPVLHGANLDGIGTPVLSDGCEGAWTYEVDNDLPAVQAWYWPVPDGHGDGDVGVMGPSRASRSRSRARTMCRLSAVMCREDIE